ncbi:hypothetical protein [Mycoplasmoides pneumoniae]|uniref:hypothetical protein n=1 Tax=Mycoplasmoides pneumoniae TaxID=2104 RepID=UPI002329A512|nr:hypothetical protein [Mycoplasmoides pneumoniae]GLL60759.1 hypothetical protein OA571N_6440 [Mycoplasmoides pneumoniae]
MLDKLLQKFRDQKKPVFHKEEGYWEISALRKWAAILIIAFGDGIIYIVPYFAFFQFKTAVANVTGVEPNRISLLLTAYGIVSLLFYIPGGWLADRISAKALFSVSMFGTGIITFWYFLVGLKGIVWITPN